MQRRQALSLPTCRAELQSSCTLRRRTKTTTSPTSPPSALPLSCGWPIFARHCQRNFSLTADALRTLPPRQPLQVVLRFLYQTKVVLRCQTEWDFWGENRLERGLGWGEGKGKQNAQKEWGVVGWGRFCITLSCLSAHLSHFLYLRRILCVTHNITRVCVLHMVLKKFHANNVIGAALQQGVSKRCPCDSPCRKRGISVLGECKCRGRGHRVRICHQSYQSNNDCR